MSVMLCVPVWNGDKASYLSVPLGYRMWQKKESKLELAATMIRQVMPEFHSKKHVIILCDSWYTKQNLVSIVDEYPNLDLIGNARIDSVIYDLAPARTGHRGVLPNMENVFLLRRILRFPTNRLVIIIPVSAESSLRSLATGKSLHMSQPRKKSMVQNGCFSVQFSRKICRFFVRGRKKQH